MSTGILHKLHKQYHHALKDGIWDAWGIVISPSTAHLIKQEAIEQMQVFYYGETAEIKDKLFGLVVIIRDYIEDGTAYIVDEQLGRTLLTEKRERQWEYEQITG